MSKLANWLARWVWWSVLWLMRRRAIKTLQRRSVAWLPERTQIHARASLRRQNRFARRHGQQILTWTITLFLASVLLTWTFLLALNLYDSGMLTMSTELRDEVESRANR